MAGLLHRIFEAAPAEVDAVNLELGTKSPPAKLVNWVWFHDHRRGLSGWSSSVLTHLVIALALLFISAPRGALEGDVAVVASRVESPEILVILPHPFVPPQSDPEPQLLGSTETPPAIVEPAPEPADEISDADKQQPDSTDEPQVEETLEETNGSLAETPPQVTDQEDLADSGAPPTERGHADGPSPVEEVTSELLEKPKLVNLPLTTKSRGAEFFGLRAQGQRFVFLLDMSWSMYGPRWRDAGAELVRTIEGLENGQAFCVIGFDVDAHPLLNDSPGASSYLPASTASVQKLERWLSELELGYETNPLPAVQLAVTLEPDAIFLLSDGKFHRETLTFLRSVKQDQPRSEFDGIVPEIHTIALYSGEGHATLQEIAYENGGRFRYVPAPPTDWAVRLERRDADPDERHAIAMLSHAGAKLEADNQGHVRKVVHAAADSDFERFTFFKHVEELWLGGSRPTEHGLRQLHDLERLKLLVLADSSVGNVEMEVIAGLDNLEALFIEGTQVTDAGMRHLRHLKHLRVLSTSGQLSDIGLKHLQSLPQLETLYLVEPNVTDAGLQYLRSMQNLTTLVIGGSPVGPSGLANLAELPNLRAVHLLGPLQPQDGMLPTLQALARCRALESLDLSGTSTNDGDLRAFTEHSSLRVLNLDGTQISDRGVEHLEAIPHLSAVSLRNTDVTWRGRERLERHLSRDSLKTP